jgi:hypothetical protein
MMFDEQVFWQLDNARQTSAAKGIMGVRPLMHEMFPD